MLGWGKEEKVTEKDSPLILLFIFYFFSKHIYYIKGTCHTAILILCK